MCFRGSQMPDYSVYLVGYSASDFAGSAIYLIYKRLCNFIAA
jgi:hypothetical protein